MNNKSYLSNQKYAILINLAAKLVQACFNLYYLYVLGPCRLTFLLTENTVYFFISVGFSYF